MIGDRFLESVALAHEQVGVAGDVDKHVEPQRVSRKREQPLPGPDAQGQRRGAGGMAHLEGLDFGTADMGILAGDQFHEPKLETEFDVGGIREKNLLGGTNAFFDTRGAGDRQRPCPVRYEMRVQDEKGKPAEMIAVQMRQDDGIDRVGIDAEGIDADHRAGAEIDEIARVFRLQMEARIATPAAAEGVAAADYGEFQAHAPALGRRDTSAYQRSTLAQLSGTPSRTGRMKSIATSAVISATV